MAYLALLLKIIVERAVQYFRKNDSSLILKRVLKKWLTHILKSLKYLKAIRQIILQYYNMTCLIGSNDLRNSLTLLKKWPYSELFWSAFSPHFPYSVRMRENAGKMRTRVTPNTDTFYPVYVNSSWSFIIIAQKHSPGGFLLKKCL